MRAEVSGSREGAEMKRVSYLRSAGGEKRIRNDDRTEVSSSAPAGSTGTRRYQIQLAGVQEQPHIEKQSISTCRGENRRGCELCGATLPGQTEQIINFKKTKSKEETKGTNTAEREKRKELF